MPTTAVSDTANADYSITSWAATIIDVGIVRPSIFAAFALTISSNLVGCWTASSFGFSPRSMRSMYPKQIGYIDTVGHQAALGGKDAIGVDCGQAIALGKRNKSFYDKQPLSRLAIRPRSRARMCDLRSARDGGARRQHAPPARGSSRCA